MDRGALYAEEHDLILRKLPKTTGRPLAHWFAELEKAGVTRKGFLAGLDLLRDKLGVPHAEAAAIAWTFMNPSMVPDSLRPAGAEDAEGKELDHAIAAQDKARAKRPKATRAKATSSKAASSKASRAKVKPAKVKPAKAKAKPAKAKTKSRPAKAKTKKRKR